ncbi:histone-lysine N-methyltransferase, H3 lysine-9 specific SUVH4-like isoform X2 [Silene latifolia]|uniref:histone-lysine N-methyltransferase, H3 lysine-9 specific SUVH4-like isoform X2 n=1 Tax=Silene latifolia TaxID=37657 RepID=UPI003D7852ED
MTDAEVEIVEVVEGGRRRSERTRGKKVCYTEKSMQSTSNETPPKKRKTTQKHSKKTVLPGVMPVVSKQMVKDLPVDSTVSELGESTVSEEIDKSHLGESTDSVEMVKSLPREFMEEEGGLMGRGIQPREVDAGVSLEKSAHLKVKETLRAFNNYYLHFIQEEEKRCKKAEEEMRKSDGKPIKSSSKRPDLKASSKMRQEQKILYREKQIGRIHGVDVGHQFFSRAEMVVVGFHSHWLNGIDYIGKGHSNRNFSKYKLPLAVAIVMSGQYEDDLDNSEDVIYTGQGGHDLLGNKKQIADQKMTGGNLALQNSMLEGLPVRVIRGHPSKSSYVGKVYTYDGLYKVNKCWAEKGVSGFTVYKFRMERLGDQPELTTTQVQFIRGRVPDTIADLRGLVCDDISGGLENIPIPATNLVDDSPLPTTGFKYRTSIKVSGNLKIPGPTVGCRCVGSCVDPNVCACAKLNGSDFPYVQRDGGRLVEAKAVVFECGPKCGCGPACVNRTSQKGLRFRFEVFRTPKKGWGVRSWDYIPAGSPICEYIGVLKRSDEANSVLDNMYIFDIDCLQTMKGLDGREMRLGDVPIPSEVLSEKVDDGTAEFCIDAVSTGNFARFINHSCEPNLFIQCILSSHHDIKLARIMLFAADNIPPLQELSYDYGYALDSVIGPDGKIKQMACYCGAAGCRKRLF